ncbi:hypothetical protein [Streptomyces sp. JH34]|uniref:hypothetical protein n=1 Tax=unclassified Streptomyces TaxID=2593676 RepID=UPI0023F9E1C2|nr:hypothetical protein [Streptomyces sp. JH34]MDF6016993.1 hypothetical protein [Streptomyces sp. JH34]
MQTVLGYAHLSTTADVQLGEGEEHVNVRAQAYLVDVEERAALAGSGVRGE